MIFDSWLNPQRSNWGTVNFYGNYAPMHSAVMRAIGEVANSLKERLDHRSNFIIGDPIILKELM